MPPPLLLLLLLLLFWGESTPSGSADTDDFRGSFPGSGADAGGGEDGVSEQVALFDYVDVPQSTQWLRAARRLDDTDENAFGEEDDENEEDNSSLEPIHIVNCRGDNKCTGEEKTCKGGPGMRCLFDCSGNDACKDTTFICNDEADCLVYCQDKSQCTGNDGEAILQCPQKPRFCGYYKAPNFEGSNTISAINFRSCDDAEDHDYEGKFRESGRFFYCGGRDDVNSRGNGGNPFEQLVCQDASCLVSAGDDEMCVEAKFPEKCHEPKNDHSQTNCEGRKAFHNGKLHAWCTSENSEKIPTCTCDNGTPTLGRAGNQCPVAMKRCKKDSCDSNSKYNETTGLCVTTENTCTCAHGIGATGEECLESGPRCAASNGCEPGYCFNATTFECDECVCNCPNGKGATGEECLESGPRCAASNGCDPGYCFNATTFECNECVCNCPNGKRATGVNCTAHGATACGVCDTGYRLNQTNPTCERYVQTPPPSSISSTASFLRLRPAATTVVEEGGDSIALILEMSGTSILPDLDKQLLRCESLSGFQLDRRKPSRPPRQVLLNGEASLGRNATLDPALVWGLSGSNNLIMVTVPFDVSNKEQPSRNITVTCHLLESRGLVLATGSTGLSVINIVRPVPGSVTVGYHLDQENDAVVTEWGKTTHLGKQLQGERPFAVWTSGRVSLKLGGHPLLMSHSGNVVFAKDMKALAVPVGRWMAAVNNTRTINLPLVRITETVVGNGFGVSAVFSLPSFEEACGGGNIEVAAAIDECAFGIRLENPKAVPPFGKGGTFSCPPSFSNSLCFDGDTEEGNAVHAARDNLVSEFWAIKYVAACQDPQYMPPGHEVCSNFATAPQCAFGSRDDCSPCPAGAQCPGGYHAFSFPGYYTIDSSSGDVRQCDMPSKLRCVGWSELTGRSTCGGESQMNDTSQPLPYCYRGSMCAHCCEGFFAAPDGTCERCPPRGKEYDALVSALWPFVCVLFGVCLVMLVLTFRLETAKYNMEDGGNDHRWEVTLRQTKEFGIWVFLSAQVMASATSTPSSNLPRWIIQMYASVAFFNLDSDYVVHPSCVDGQDPHFTSRLMLGGTLGITVLQLTIFVVSAGLRRRGKHRTADSDPSPVPPGSTLESKWTRHLDSVSGCYFFQHTETGESKWDAEEVEGPEDGGEEPQKSAPSPQTTSRSRLIATLARIQGKVFVAMSCVVPIVFKYTIRILHCTVEDDNILAASSMERRKAMIMHTAPVRTVCWEGEHVSLAVLAVLVAGFFLCGYPIASFVYLRRVVQDLKRSDLRLKRWEHFIGDDYKPEMYWFRHVYWLLHFFMLMTYELSNRGAVRCVMTIVLMCCYMALLLKFQPFSELDTWKLHVRALLAVLSCLIALLDMTNWSEVEEGVAVGTYGSTVFAYLVFANSMALIALLPLVFFVVNYGVCDKFRRRRETSDNVQLENERELELAEFDRHFDEASGAYFLHHRGSGEVKWEIENPMTKDPEILAVVRNDEWWALAKEKERACVGGWVEVVEENGQTVYAHLETGQVSMTRPPEWVKEMIKYYHHPSEES